MLRSLTAAEMVDFGMPSIRLLRAKHPDSQLADIRRHAESFRRDEDA